MDRDKIIRLANGIGDYLKSQGPSPGEAMASIDLIYKMSLINAANARMKQGEDQIDVVSEVADCIDNFKKKTLESLGATTDE